MERGNILQRTIVQRNPTRLYLTASPYTPQHLYDHTIHLENCFLSHLEGKSVMYKEERSLWSLYSKLEIRLYENTGLFNDGS